MSIQSGTPTVIRHAVIGGRTSVVVTVSTPSAFTAHHHVYDFSGGYGRLCKSFGSWTAEIGAIDSHDEWIERNSPTIE